MKQLENLEGSESFHRAYSIHTPRMNTYVVLEIRNFIAYFGDKAAPLIKLLVPLVLYYEHWV